MSWWTCTARKVDLDWWPWPWPLTLARSDNLNNVPRYHPTKFHCYMDKVHKWWLFALFEWVMWPQFSEICKTHYLCVVSVHKVPTYQISSNGQKGEKHVFWPCDLDLGPMTLNIELIRAMVIGTLPVKLVHCGISGSKVMAQT